MRAFQLTLIIYMLSLNPSFSMEKSTVGVLQNSEVEIHPNKLPIVARVYIMENYAGCEIVKAYKLNTGHAAYKVVLKVNKLEKQLLFSKEGKVIAK